MNLKEAMAELRKTQASIDTIIRYERGIIAAIPKQDADEIIKRLESHMDILEQLKVEVEI